MPHDPPTAKTMTTTKTSLNWLTSFTKSLHSFSPAFPNVTSWGHFLHLQSLSAPLPLPVSTAPPSTTTWLTFCTAVLRLPSYLWTPVNCIAIIQPLSTTPHIIGFSFWTHALPFVSLIPNFHLQFTYHNFSEAPSVPSSLYPSYLDAGDLRALSRMPSLSSSLSDILPRLSIHSHGINYIFGICQFTHGNSNYYLLNSRSVHAMAHLKSTQVLRLKSSELNCSFLDVS